jgi:hypothetical protein
VAALPTPQHRAAALDAVALGPARERLRGDPGQAQRLHRLQQQVAQRPRRRCRGSVGTRGSPDGQLGARTGFRGAVQDRVVDVHEAQCRRSDRRRH